MKIYRFFWKSHKWVGIVLSVVFLNMSITGLLLLKKKKYDWIQPPTREGAVGGVEDFITVGQLFEIVFSQGHKNFKSLQDIERVDFRPDQRIHKVHSKHNHSELQVDAVTGAVLNKGKRRSDLLEDLHDGSLWGEWAHGWLMPLAACGLFFMSGSGLYLWLDTNTRKKRRKRHDEKI